jgi:hypothetical protein
MRKAALLSAAVFAMTVMLKAQEVLAGSPWVDTP